MNKLQLLHLRDSISKTEFRKMAYAMLRFSQIAVWCRSLSRNQLQRCATSTHTLSHSQRNLQKQL